MPFLVPAGDPCGRLHRDGGGLRDHGRTGGITVKAPDGTTTATLVLPFGLMRLVFGLTFTVGLILVMVAGAELFTGNTLIIMGWASKKVSTASLLRNWASSTPATSSGRLSPPCCSSTPGSIP